MATIDLSEALQMLYRSNYFVEAKSFEPLRQEFSDQQFSIFQLCAHPSCLNKSRKPILRKYLILSLREQEINAYINQEYFML